MGRTLAAVSTARAACLVTLLAASVAPAQAALPSQRAPLRTRELDVARKLDLNRVNIVTSNEGSFAYDIAIGSAGLVWPRGGNQTAVFASGLWLGGLVGGIPRVTVAEYSDEYQPGSIVGGIPDPPFNFDNHVYKMVRWTGNPADSEHVDRSPGELAADPHLDPLLHHSWAEYRAGAATHGAPMRVYRLPVTSTPDPTDSVDVPGPDVSGDMMLWCVYNDADPSAHNNRAGSTLPLGVEVQQTMFAFDGPGDLRDVVYLRFRILNKGGNAIDDFHASLWCDPDLGDFSDDLIGCSPPRQLGFAYNGRDVDNIYGTPPPAVGYRLLAGPIPPGGVPLGMTAFAQYINGGEVQSALESFNLMHGLAPDGTPRIDPTSGLPTTFMVSGDPVAGTGWLDSPPADQRFLMSSGPAVLAPGDAQELWGAITMGRGGDRLASVGVVRCVSELALDAFASGFKPPLPVQDVPCSTATARALVNCPRPAAYWGTQCAAGGTDELTAAQLQAAAAAVDARSVLFDWGGAALPSFCATLNPGGADLRQRARREFATFLANYSGNTVPLNVPGGQRILLYPPTPVSCPPLTATNIEQLAATADLSPKLVDAHYLDVNGNGQSLQGTSIGLPFFDGGAGVAADFLGSSLDQNTQPDSFATVEIRFSTTARQKAHRLLRLEKADGSIPTFAGRGYNYGGFFDCDFQVWDVTHNVQLDAVFVERYLVLDDFGTPSPDTSTIVSLDRTWAPTDEANGGREYLMILNRPYDGTPKDEVRVQDALLNAQLPLQYALAARRDPAFPAVDDGDAFRFERGRPPSPGADLLLIDLENGSLGDPAVQQAYSDLIDCLSAINSGVGIGETCTSIPTPTLVSLVDAFASSDRVTLRWHSDADVLATVERRARGEGWRALGSVTPDGSHQLLFEDRDIVPGTTYDYRLAIARQAGIEYFGRTSVDVPSGARLALSGMWAEPGGARIVVRFSLASRAAARFEVLDVAGRRVLARDLGGLEAGSHVLTLDAGARLASGVYLMRLTQSGDRAIGKAAIIR